MSPPTPSPASRATRASYLRLGVLLVGFAAVALAANLSGWQGPERLRELVDSAGPAGALVFVVGYAVLVLLPLPASVLTILGGALFGLWWGTLLAWSAAVLGATGGFGIGRRIGRSAVDRLLQGRLRQADALLADHGFLAVLTVRLVPIFPFTPLNYASGLLGVRLRDYVLGTTLGILPGTLAYAAVGASGANPTGIVVAVGGLLALTVVGSLLGRRLARRDPTPGGPPPTDGRSDA